VIQSIIQVPTPTEEDFFRALEILERLGVPCQYDEEEVKFYNWDFGRVGGIVIRYITGYCFVRLTRCEIGREDLGAIFPLSDMESTLKLLLL